MKQIRLRLVLLCIVVGWPGIVMSGEALKLSSLKPGCRLELADVDPGPPGVWLTCPSGRFHILGRPNLEKQVAIRTPPQAMEFVRLFSTADTWYLSSVDQMVEVTAGPTAERCSFTLPRYDFLQCCVPATASRSKDRTFVVRRTVVLRDYRAYAISQEVQPDGTVQLLELDPLSIDGHSLGGFCDPHIM
jgi:hypothetical protein